MSRENEKVLAELRKFLELHNEELNDEKDFDRLAEQFLSQHNGSPDGGSMGEIETADDYLELAEQAAKIGRCPLPGSGRQEYLESVVNQVLFE